ncbi:TPA: ead/Ea22-like family protein [Klebsiella pneumoniae]|nr:ead/Ea22-like family protein [Klebsiella pneumoniae]HBR4649341.1 ead/Ea22-like family protein [Klebsiella pneumoniae]HBR4799200.1 ead/Ea22-like family protein [Klebsiella pneumoniae]HBR5161646.1 ead/Ea22-like family protein [Klebsiella pneumoniae]HBR5169036.1 ead/Ea22-like family protein [Klebsiella pneumoniae]
MTNITELAQSLKAAATNVKETAHIARYLKATIARQTFKELMTPENILALVEALEKAEQYSKERDEENQDLMLTIGRLRVEREGLEAIRAAAEKLVRCKGRYHSEQNYRALAALFGVNTPDLPPLEHENVHYADAAEMEIAALRQRIAELESRTVKLPEPFELAGLSGGSSYYYADEVDAALTAQGIKVEAE